jgi:CubicO group peptidase (beta-lactamase class C family)
VDEGALAVVLQRQATAQGVPGAALGMLRRGERVAAYYGVADARTASAVTASTRFGIGSLTKSMVASALAVLDAEHQLSIDDPVASHVPELRLCPWAQAATLRDLLANRSPVPLRSALEFGFDEQDGDDDRALARLVEELAVHAPSGGHWSYANVGWCVLGRAIETLAGVVWEEAMPRFLAPAGLSETTWTTSAILDRAVGHDASPGGPVPVEPLLCRAYSPAGATIASTLEDMLRYAAWHLADPVLAPLRVVHADLSIRGWFDGWGLGLGRFDWDGVEVWGWDGVVHGQRSVLRLLPDQGGAVVVLSNGSSGRAMVASVVAEVVHAWFGVNVPTARLDPLPDVPEQLAAYAGTYGWPDRRVDVTESARGLLITEDGIAKEAVPLDRRTFLVDRDDPDSPTITFSDFDGAGRPGVLYDMVWGLGRLSGG